MSNEIDLIKYLKSNVGDVLTIIDTKIHCKNIHEQVHNYVYH